MEESIWTWSLKKEKLDFDLIISRKQILSWPLSCLFGSTYPKRDQLCILRMIWKQSWICLGSNQDNIFIRIQMDLGFRAYSKVNWISTGWIGSGTESVEVSTARFNSLVLLFFRVHAERNWQSRSHIFQLAVTASHWTRKICCHSPRCWKGQHQRNQEPCSCYSWAWSTMCVMVWTRWFSTLKQLCGEGHPSWTWAWGQKAKKQPCALAISPHPDHSPDSSSLPPWFSGKTIINYKKAEGRHFCWGRAAKDNGLNLDQVNQMYGESFTCPG